MPIVQINNVSVQFPFEPYDVQKEYMEKIIESLRTRRNAILESPSGTGKTLSLLCATLAWFKQSNVPYLKVIYATRTHSQILQAMRELKKTAYNDLKATVIASRDQLCIHPELVDKSNTDKILMCKNMMHKSRDGEIRSTCEHYCKIEEIPKLDDIIPNITDIEDLDSIGRDHSCCPYFVTKQKALESDIIFIPYSYLIDPIIRDSYDIDLENSIILIDEAHNLNRVCEDSASTSIKVTDISAALRDLNSFTNDVLYGFGREERLKRSLQNLKNRLMSMQIGTRDGGFLFDLLHSVDIMMEDSSSIIELLENLITAILTNQNTNADEYDKPGSGLKTLLRFLQTIFSSPEEHWDSSYRVYIEKKLLQNQTAQSKDTDETTHETTLHFWCFNPEIRMRELLGHRIRSLILTSSTLTPFNSFIAELGVQFPIQFTSDHVIEAHQKFAKILTHGNGEVLLDSKFINRENEGYLSSIGRSIHEIVQKVPGGLLVFFPSYKFMENCMAFWGKDGNTGIWNEISQRAAICIELRDRIEFKDAIKTYYQTIREGNKAIFLAVARGKISEGLDFSDIYGRAVMLVGFPCAPHNDPKIIEKKRYLDAAKIQRNNLPTGNEWYVLDAVRTANQAMGRVIRHRHDYGAMLLCDARFAKNENKQLISKWIRNRLTRQRNATFDQNVQELSLFYSNAEQMLPTHDPDINPESFVLYEDDEWFSTLQYSESHPDQSTSDQHTDDSIDETLNNSAGSSLQNSTEVYEQQPTNQQEEGDTRKRGTSTVTCDQNQPSSSHAANVSKTIQSDDSCDESGVRPKRTKNSKKIVIESDSECNSNQDENSGPLINFLKNSLKNDDKYKKLEQITSKYNDCGQYEAFRDDLFKVFKEPEFVFFLRGCIILFKKEHKENFQKDCEQFILSSQ